MTIVKITAGKNKCSICGKVSDLRPYGENGAFICFDCGMKNEKETSENYKKILELGTLIIDSTKI